VLRGHQVDSEPRHSTPQIPAELFGAFLRLACALRIENQDYTIKRGH